MHLFHSFADRCFPIGMWIARSMPRSTVFAIAIAALYVSPVAAGVMTIKNDSGAARTLADLTGFSGLKQTGMSKIHLKKGDITDDVNIANFGQKKYAFDFDVKSLTVSWLDKDGKEVETDIESNSFNFTAQLFAFFQRPDGGDFAVAYSDGNGFLPTVNDSFVISNGKIPGMGFDQITFYDVGPDGLILRDALGNPLSPLLDGVSVTTDFQYSLSSVPEPSTMTLMVFGIVSLFVVFRKRLRTGAETSVGSCEGIM